jgi:hypothetical protein
MLYGGAGFPLMMETVSLVESESPRDWCYRVLTMIRARQAHRRQVGTLEMLLSYFIECDPDPAGFDILLSQYVQDPRRDISVAATVLRRAWGRVRGRRGEAVVVAVTLQEALRTLGGILDDWGAFAAYVAADPAPQEVHVIGEIQPGRFSKASLGLDDLQREIAARMALRGQLPTPLEEPGERYEQRLRVVGGELDEQPAQSYRLIVTRQTIVIEGSGGYFRVYTTVGLSEQVGEFMAQRREPGS